MNITLDSTKVVLARWPRTKKRRIQRKWARRKQNWKPDPRIWGTYLMLGANAVARADSPAAKWEPQYDGNGDRMPDGYVMHPATWAKVREASMAGNIGSTISETDVFDEDAWRASLGCGNATPPWEKLWRKPRGRQFRAA